MTFAQSRRNMLRLAAGAFVSGLASPALAQEPSIAELMAPGALPDLWSGSANAPVTIIEYASMTCNHCAAFHERTMPMLRKDYIATGKVRFVLREFPLEPFALAAFMLARSFGERRDEIVDFLFATQSRWLFVQDTMAGLTAIMKEKGMSDEDFQSTLRNETLMRNVMSVRDVAADEFGVQSTPTFFINGKMVLGNQSPDAMRGIIDPLVKI